jgi:hypothetical protein
MASSFTTSLGIEEMVTGEKSGTWGTISNFNWDIMDRITAYTSVALSGTTHTLTVREASPGTGTENLQDGMYRVIKFTGALGANNTVTIAPNTTKVFFIIINATTDSGSSGPYSVILTQGSGANVTVQNGNNAVVYCDGGGSGAVVTDALSDLQIGDDLSLVSDSAVINLGADNDVTITHVADVGLKLKQAGATGDGKPFILTMQTGELDIAADDVLGQIDFQAPDEATGTDAILVAAGISAISEGDFSASNNATKLSFKTGASEAATEKMYITSAGNVNMKNTATGDDTPMVVTLQTGETDIAAADVLGQIDFQAPDEGTGTDAILVAAGIAAVSEGDFSSSNNATKLSFKTAASEAAAEKMSLSSAGNLDVTGDITGATLNADGDTSASDNAAMGYTSTEGLILTGQGSTNDVTVKNDADTTVFQIPTGTSILRLSDASTIDMSTPLLAGADHTFTGLSAQMLAGGAIAAFDLVCVHTTTQEVVEADASAYATARVIGIAPAAISDTATGTILLHGFIRDDTWTWTTGSTLYLSETAGAMTHTAPSTDGAFVQVVGVALSPDVVYINPSMDVIERA